MRPRTPVFSIPPWEGEPEYVTGAASRPRGTGSPRLSLARECRKSNARPLPLCAGGASKRKHAFCSVLLPVAEFGQHNVCRSKKSKGTKFPWQEY